MRQCKPRLRPLIMASEERIFAIEHNLQIILPISGQERQDTAENYPLEPRFPASLDFDGSKFP